jgi:hypothetical protein
METNRTDKRKFKCRLACSEDTHRLIMEECVQEFLKHNPDFEGIHITHDMILRRVALFYLDRIRGYQG